jgi:hypothetical protein
MEIMFAEHEAETLYIHESVEFAGYGKVFGALEVSW